MDEAQAARFAASKASVSQAIESLRGTILSREAKAAQLRAEPEAPARDAALALAESELQEARNSYASALKAEADLRLLEARSGERLSVVEPARVPNAAIRPSRSRVILLGAFGGLGAALAVIVGVMLLERVVSRGRRLEHLVGLPVLTEVPANGDAADLRAGRVADAYAALPGRIAEQGVAVRSILVTSAQALAGRGTVAASLAVALAQSGRRVVLVDANLREPTQAGLFDLPDAAGLSTLLFSTGRAAESVLRDTTVGGLRLVTAGPLPPDAGAFLREHSYPRPAGGAVRPERRRDRGHAADLGRAGRVPDRAGHRRHAARRRCGAGARPRHDGHRLRAGGVRHPRDRHRAVTARPRTRSGRLPPSLPARRPSRRSRPSFS